MRRTTIFTKQPSVGKVKTRLCPPLELAEAARLAEAMLIDIVEKCVAEAEFETALRFAPRTAETWFRSRFPRVRDLAPQRGDGLAERLAAHFEAEARRDPKGSAVVIGSDAPLLRASEIVRAHELLEAGADLVLAPDRGGGYALIGLRSSHPSLFLDVPMSTADMCARTLEQARALSLRVDVLAPCSDVDVATDLQQLARELAERAPESLDYPRYTARVISELSCFARRTQPFSGMKDEGEL